MNLKEQMQEKFDNLQAHLTNNPQLSTVYFNSKNEWLFSEHPQYPHEVSREDVLEADSFGEATGRSGEADASEVMVYGKMNVEALTKELNSREIQIPAGSKKQDLIDLLEQYDEANPLGDLGK